MAVNSSVKTFTIILSIYSFLNKLYDFFPQVHTLTCFLFVFLYLQSGPNVKLWSWLSWCAWYTLSIHFLTLSPAASGPLLSPSVNKLVFIELFTGFWIKNRIFQKTFVLVYYKVKVKQVKKKKTMKNVSDQHRITEHTAASHRLTTTRTLRDIKGFLITVGKVLKLVKIIQLLYHHIIILMKHTERNAGCQAGFMLLSYR